MHATSTQRVIRVFICQKIIWRGFNCVFTVAVNVRRDIDTIYQHYRTDRALPSSPAVGNGRAAPMLIYSKCSDTSYHP